ncbi:hypothetical protein AVEN_232015-1 [Araneus ventricosus]|uniref:Uncharacterized protein n=1 Tax=Araneus ventricosus TaxID=182803 RepID=A0A4Y2L3R2_ARAVE|nr:hypothetical protein AVEN_232015-1 [Araneus ventricosus]
MAPEKNRKFGLYGRRTIASITRSTCDEPSDRGTTLHRRWAHKSNIITIIFSRKARTSLLIIQLLIPIFKESPEGIWRFNSAQLWNGDYRSSTQALHTKSYYRWFGKVGIPTRLVFHSARLVIKVKYDPSRQPINHPCVIGSVGESECAWELRLVWRNQGGEGRMLSLKSEIPPCWVGGVGVIKEADSAFWRIRE